MYIFNMVLYDIGHLTIQRTYFFTIINNYIASVHSWSLSWSS